MSDITTNPSDIGDTARAVISVNGMAGDLARGKKFSSAKIALCRALTAMPDNYELWANLSSVLWSLHAYEDSLQCAVNSIKYNKTGGVSLIPALISAGNAQMALGEYKTALSSFSTALSHEDEDHKADDARWNKCMLNLLMGHYSEAWKDHHLRLERLTIPTKVEDLNASRWCGEYLAGKSLLIIQEQGIGDAIMFSRFLDKIIFNYNPDVVYLQVPVELFPLLWGYEHLGVKFLPLGRNQAPSIPHVDLYTYVGDLASFMCSNPSEVPPPSDVIKDEVLRAIVGNWRNKAFIDSPKMKPHLKVGICWTGSPDHPRDSIRNIPLKLLASLAEDPRVWLYSLQMGKASEEIKELGLEPFVMDLSGQIKDKGWMGTATAIMQLDVIVTCDTSVAHLAGTLGVPTFIVIPTEPYWPWGPGETEVKTPWYPSVRLFRQAFEQRGNWLYPIEAVRGQLRSKLEQL